MTAQVGPQLSEYLDIPQLTYATHIEIADTKVRVKQKLGGFKRLLEAPMPALITIEREAFQPRVAPMDTILEAYGKEIPVWRPEDLNGEEDNFGLKGSPTKLRKVYTPKLLKGKVEMLDGGPEEVAGKLVGKLKEKYII
jgi:electron transfer flavoprotein beta subunit